MALVTQILVCFHTIRTFPGLTLEELGEKIDELYGHMFEVRSLVSKDDYSFLAGRIRDIHSVEVREGRYYYNPEAKPYSKDKIINYCIEMQLKQEEEQKRNKPREGD